MASVKIQLTLCMGKHDALMTIAEAERLQTGLTRAVRSALKSVPVPLRDLEITSADELGQDYLTATVVPPRLRAARSLIRERRRHFD